MPNRYFEGTLFVLTALVQLRASLLDLRLLESTGSASSTGSPDPERHERRRQADSFGFLPGRARCGIVLSLRYDGAFGGSERRHGRLPGWAWSVAWSAAWEIWARKAVAGGAHTSAHPPQPSLLRSAESALRAMKPRGDHRLQQWRALVLILVYS